MRLHRTIRTAFSLAAAVISGAALLQWGWAGWSPYAGAGPPLGTRWLLTSSIGAALLLPPCAAMAGAAAARRLTDTGLLDQLRITRWSASRLAVLLSLHASAPLLLALLVSASAWLALALAAPSAFLRGAGVEERVGAPAIETAHGVAAMICAAFGLWGAALAAGKPRPGRGRWSDWRRLGAWGLPAQLLLSLGPWLIGPVLPHLVRPERALDAVLFLNPGTAVGAALGMDLLRSPRLYGLTRAPEYWYTYPPAWAVAALYGLLAVMGLYQLRRRLSVG